MVKKKFIILTGGDGGTGNLGDEFILSAIKKFYQPFTQKFKIIILKHDLPKRLPRDRFTYINDFEENFALLKIPTSDIAIVHYYGGGYLNKYWYEDKIWLYRYLIHKGLDTKKFIFTGQGLGPFAKNQKKELSKIVNQVLYFGVRDKLSIKEFPKAVFNFDDTISLVKPNKPKLWRKYAIGINIRLLHEHAVIERQKLINVLQIIQKFAQLNHCRMYFFSMVKNPGYSEITPLIELAKEARLSGYNFNDRNKNYRKLLKDVGRSELIITTSYHSTLAALYTKTPVICIYQNEYYRLKFEGLREIFPSPFLNICFINDFSLELITSILNLKTPKNNQVTNELIFRLAKRNQLVFSKIEKILRNDTMQMSNPNKK
jgi:polysaccharide pyruvyl transferase WcaK-like protein